MKITKSQLRRIIQEELQNVLHEQTVGANVAFRGTPPPTTETGEGGETVTYQPASQYEVSTELVQGQGDRPGFGSLAAGTPMGGPAMGAAYGPSADQLQNALDKGHISPEEYANVLRTGNVQGTEPAQRVAARQRLNAPVGPTDFAPSGEEAGRMAQAYWDRDKQPAAGAPAAVAAAAPAADSVQRDAQGRPVLPKNWKKLPRMHPQRVAVRNYRKERRSRRRA